MIYVIDATNRKQYGGYLNQSFRHRYQFLHVKSGWENHFSFFGMEIDQYDTLTATYLLCIEKGRVLGGIRLMPTYYGTYVGEFHADDVTDPTYPEKFGLETWEMYRLFVSDQKWRSPETEHSAGGYRARTIVMLNAMKYMLDEGASRVLAVSDLEHLTKLPPTWKWRRIAPDHKYTLQDGNRAPAAIVEIDVTPETVHGTNNLLGFQGVDYARAEVEGNGLEPAPIRILPEHYYLLNNWLSNHCEHANTVKQLLETADTDDSSYHELMTFIETAIREGITGPLERPVQEQKTYH